MVVLFIGSTACNPNLSPGSYENRRGHINETIPILSYWTPAGYILTPGLYENWRGYTNGTIPIQSYWTHTGYILAAGPYED